MDVLEAKQVLSALYLPQSLRGRVVERVTTMRVDEAVAGARQNVHAIGVGHKMVNGSPAPGTGLVVRIHVVQKIAPSLLPPRDRIPEQIDGIPTDIIESAPAFAIGKASAAAPLAAPACTGRRREAQRPLIGGISTAHQDVTAGTLGYFCRSLRHGDDPGMIYILSNNHVLANVNMGAPADRIYQPGPADGGDVTSHVANLVRYKSIDLSGAPNKVDCAIASLVPGIQWRPEICSVGTVNGIGTATVGMAVCKHGRTSGFTRGSVTDINYDALIGMDHSNPSVVALFQDQLRIESPNTTAFGLGGDSGSLVLEEAKNRAVGLYFAGPPSGQYGVANQVSDVLNELEIALVDGAEDGAIA